jgi:hypothetical protein
VGIGQESSWNGGEGGRGERGGGGGWAGGAGIAMLHAHRGAAVVRYHLLAWQFVKEQMAKVKLGALRQRNSSRHPGFVN